MPEQGTDHGPEILLALRRSTGAPTLAAQVEEGLRAAIRDGRLAPGARLPPTRTLARDVGVTRRLVVGAYEQLVAEGWLDARVGAGTYVRRALPSAGVAGARPSDDGPAGGRAPSVTGLEPVPYDFFPGHPDLAAFPRAAWGRALRDALHDLPDAALGYGDPRGLEELRSEIAVLVARARGVVADPARIVVCQGAAQALGLLVAALGRGSRIAVEDPYLPEHRDLLAHHGAEVVPVPVDELGIRDVAVARADARAVLLTPAHQCPTGAVLAPGRRAELARWADASGALLIEDDYDAEYRYDRAPVAALQALAPDSVAYIGSVSKTLAPALRLAWLVVPPALLDAVVEAKRRADQGSPVIDQAAFARFLRAGAYDRHVRASRRAQRARRDALVAAVAREIPGARVEGVAAGLHALVRLPRAVPTGRLLHRARARGVGAYPLGAWFADPMRESAAIVLGYGALSPAAIGEGVRRLGEVVSELSGGVGPPEKPRRVM